MAHARSFRHSYRAAFLPKASLPYGECGAVRAAAVRVIREKRIPRNVHFLGRPAMLKLIGELWGEHRAAGGRRRMPAIEKMSLGDLKKTAREIGLINQTLRGERKPAR